MKASSKRAYFVVFVAAMGMLAYVVFGGTL